MPSRSLSAGQPEPATDARECSCWYEIPYWQRDCAKTRPDLTPTLLEELSQLLVQLRLEGLQPLSTSDGLAGPWYAMTSSLFKGTACRNPRRDGLAKPQYPTDVHQSHLRRTHHPLGGTARAVASSWTGPDAPPGRIPGYTGHTLRATLWAAGAQLLSERWATSAYHARSDVARVTVRNHTGNKAFTNPRGSRSLPRLMRPAPSYFVEAGRLRLPSSGAEERHRSSK